MKLVTLEAFFPEMKGGRAYVSARGSGGNFAAALSRAARELVRDAKIKGRHFSTVKLTVSISDIRHETAPLETIRELLTALRGDYQALKRDQRAAVAAALRDTIK